MPAHKITRRRVLAGLGGTVAAGVATVGYGVLEPMLRPRVTRYRLSPPDWPSGLRLKVAVIADVHACEPFMTAERIAGIAEQANALAPDLTVLLGDYVTDHRFQRGRVPDEAWSRALGILRAPLGVHAILGNHDWWVDAGAQQARKGPVRGARALEKAGIPVYDNAVVRLKKGDRTFWLAGLGDQLAFVNRGMPKRYRFTGVDDLSGTLAKVTDDAPIILLAHEPDIFPIVPSRVAVTLSGHTHGGQVRLLGYSPVVPSRFGNRFAYGHVIEDGQHLIVSGGLGCSIMPVRLGLPPEIVLVELGEKA